MPKPIETGERVAFSRAFLRSIHAFTGWHPFARGVVREVQDLGSVSLARIDWDDGSTSRANTRNLVLVSRLHLEPV